MRSTAVGASSSLAMRSRLLAEVDVFAGPGPEYDAGAVGTAAARNAPRSTIATELYLSMTSVLAGCGKMVLAKRQCGAGL